MERKKEKKRRWILGSLFSWLLLMTLSLTFTYLVKTIHVLIIDWYYTQKALIIEGSGDERNNKKTHKIKIGQGKRRKRKLRESSRKNGSDSLIFKPSPLFSAIAATVVNIFLGSFHSQQLQFSPILPLTPSYPIHNLFFFLTSSLCATTSPWMIIANSTWILMVDSTEEKSSKWRKRKEAPTNKPGEREGWKWESKVRVEWGSLSTFYFHSFSSSLPFSTLSIGSSQFQFKSCSMTSKEEESKVEERRRHSKKRKEVDGNKLRFLLKSESSPLEMKRRMCLTKKGKPPFSDTFTRTKEGRKIEQWNKSRFDVTCSILPGEKVDDQGLGRRFGLIDSVRRKNRKRERMNEESKNKLTSETTFYSESHQLRLFQCANHTLMNSFWS